MTVRWTLAVVLALGAALIVFLSAATVASAVLLEVNQLTTIITKESKPIPGIKGALDDVNPGDPQTILVLGSDRRFIDIKQKNRTALRPSPAHLR